MKRNIIILITFFGGLYFFLEYVLPEETGLSHGIAPIGKWTLVIGVFAFLLGVMNLSRLHMGRILHRRKGWYNSAALMISMIAMAVFWLWDYYAKGQSPVASNMKDLLFKRIMIPINSTVFSLLAFYIASAAYRSFRIKSAEAGIMIFASLIVMLGQISVGQWLTSGLTGIPYLENLQFEVVRSWLMGTWNSAAQRGILFGVLVGGLALSMRIWLSLERGAFFDRGM